VKLPPIKHDLICCCIPTGYVQELMSALLLLQAEGKVDPELPVPDFMCSKFERPDKKRATKEKQTRFGQ